ncbi:MAG TPA: globin domain-containing protein [Cyclobacteriaceae bacterium]|nr:globin domain-containing protein [Cyclobacteriaceae bacterium]
MNIEPLKPLTKDQVVILKKTFRLLNTEGMTIRFYNHLFERHPEVRSMFPEDMTEQRTKLISVFELVVFSFVEREPDCFYIHKEILAPLRMLGKKHTEKGVQKIHYPIANELLLRSIKEEAGYVFPVEAEEAWALALSHLTAAMLTESKAPQASLPSLRETFNYIKSLLFNA